MRTFNKGLETENLENFDVVCKFDADIIFPENYLEKINRSLRKKSKSRNGFWVGLLKKIPELRNQKNSSFNEA